MGVEVVVPLLEKVGFRKRAGWIFTIEIAPEVLGWLGLNRATRHSVHGEVEINPVVGVRFQEVERLVADCRSEKRHAYLPPTVSSPIGYLMPHGRYKAWTFGPGRTEEIAMDMTDAIANYGVPFMRTIVGLAELRRQLKGKLGHQDHLAYRQPVAALLAGDFDATRALLDESLAGLGSRTDLAAQDFRKFAAALHGRLPQM